MWKEAVVAQFDVLSRHYGGTEKHQGEPQSVKLVTRLKSEPEAPEYEARILTKVKTCELTLYNLKKNST
jgi:hypothetical protein